MRQVLWPLLSVAVLVLCCPVVVADQTQWSDPDALASESLTTVTSYWRYEYDPDSSSPHRVYMAAEIRNGSSRYVKNVAVRTTLRSPSDATLVTQTGGAWQEALAPGESTLFTDIVYDDSVFLTSSVDFVAFGDASSQAEYPYLADPEPLYVATDIDSGWVTYYGEFLNQTDQTWQASCKYCDALDLGAAYYENGNLVLEVDLKGISRQDRNSLFASHSSASPTIRTSCFVECSPYRREAMQHPGKWKTSFGNYRTQDGVARKFI